MAALAPESAKLEGLAKRGQRRVFDGFSYPSQVRLRFATFRTKPLPHST